MHQLHSKKDIIVHQADDIMGLQQEVAELDGKLAASKAKWRKWRRRARYLRSECDNVLKQRDEAMAELTKIIGIHKAGIGVRPTDEELAEVTHVAYRDYRAVRDEAGQLRTRVRALEDDLDMAKEAAGDYAVQANGIFDVEKTIHCLRKHVKDYRDYYLECFDLAESGKHSESLATGIKRLTADSKLLNQVRRALYNRKSLEELKHLALAEYQWPADANHTEEGGES